jgi:outer membrane receptor for ferrienterochelin and colicins
MFRGIKTMFLSAFAIAAVTAAASAFEATAAQETARLTVTVREENGVVPGAAVVAVEVESNRATRRLTDKDGSAVLDKLTPGKYDLKVTYFGFAPYEQKGIELASGESKTVDVALTFYQFSSTVTVTTTSRREELLRDVATPTTLIDEAEIRDTGGRSAKDVLIDQSGSGVQVQAGGGQGHVSINGIPNSGVLVLIDGKRRLGRDGTGNFRLEDLDLAQFERIEVVKGAGSALYGSDALGGVINFISKKAPDYGFSNNLSLNYGTYEDARFSDTLGFRSDKAGGSLTGSYRTFGGYDLDPDNPQTIGLPESKFYSFSGKGELQVTNNVVARFFGDYSRRDISSYFFSGPTQMGTQVYDSRQDKTRYTLSPEVDIALTGSTGVNLGLIYSKYNREETRVYPTFSDEQEPWLEWNTQLNATGRHIWSALGQDHFLQLGYEFRNEKMDRENLLFPETNERQVERDINVLWLQNEFTLTPEFKVGVGFRYDHYSDFGSELSPKLSAMFALTDDHRLRASYGHGFRAPSFGELYIDLGFFFKGNPDLKPEVSDSFTAGYSYSGKRAQGSIDYFYNKIKDGITFDLSRFPYTYRNLSSYTSQGINSSLMVNLAAGFSTSFSYSLIKQEDEEGEELSIYPKHSAYWKLLWSNPRLGARANIRSQMIDKVAYTDGTARPAYQMWYLQGNKDLFTTGTYKVGAYLQINNLFNKTDIFLRDSQGNPVQGDFLVWLPPRTLLFGITIDLDWTGAR